MALALGDTTRRLPAQAGALGLVTLLAFTVGYWNHSHARYAGVLALLPLTVALFCRPQVPLALGVAVLPLQLDVIGGSFRLTISDVLLTFSLLAALPPLLLHGEWRNRVRGTAPMVFLAAPFAAWLVAVAIEHASLANVAKTGQYYQLFLLPLVLGAVVMEERFVRWALAGFVATSVVLAVLWATTGGDFSFAGNKNPSGQMMANALIIVVALAPSWRWRVVTAIPLAIGLAFTLSRGSILAAGVGILVLLALRGLGSWRKTLAAVVPLAVFVGVGYQFLPEDVQARATDYSPGGAATTTGSLTSSQYSIRVREIYIEEGWELVDANPVFGVGPGNYLTGAGTFVQTDDPHNLILRTAGDTGYPGLIGFGILVVGTGLVVLRRKPVNPYVALAIAVQASLIVHGFVDVYWVRGNPVLGWLLIGMAVNRRLDYSRDRPQRHRRRLSQRRTAQGLPVFAPSTPAGVGHRQLE